MIADLLLALGLVAVMEGLAIALLPRHIEDALRRLSEMSRDVQRTVGLLILGIGVLIVWLARVIV